MKIPGEHQGGVEKEPNERIYWAAHNTLGFVARRAGIRIEGLEHARKLNNNGRGSIVASSHTSMWDVVDLASIGFDRPIRFLGRQSLLEHKLLGRPIRFLAPHARVIFLDREIKESRGVAGKQALDAVNEGDLVCFFPEGTRSKSDDPAHVGEFRPGAARTALHARGITPMLPVGIAYSEGRRFKNSPFSTGVVIGEPLYVDHQPDRTSVEELNQHLFETISELKAQAVDLAHS